jgi:osmotically-inducible protein OsmY
MFGVSAGNYSHQRPSALPSGNATMNQPNTLGDRVHQAISTNPYVRKQHLRTETANGRVVLRGTVASYYQKQMAQEALRDVEGVNDIENMLEVCWSV